MAAEVPVIGLDREREVLTVALAQGRHVVIEGPPGTGKSTLLRATARDLGRPMVFVEGNAELTPARLVGQHDPAQVLTEGYTAASFLDGPLLTAMRTGALLYLEELNRVPEETLNVLITVLAEGEIAVPRLGGVPADPAFRLIAAMNPFDTVGTARVSQAISDRMCRVVLGYQTEAAERLITAAVTRVDGARVELPVALARATRDHADLRMGASVRGAIDMTLLVAGLRDRRGEDEPTYGTVRDAAMAALSGRVRVHEGAERDAESVIDELLERLWGQRHQEPIEGDEPGKGDRGLPGHGLRSPNVIVRARRHRRDGGIRRPRTESRYDLAARHAAFAEVSPRVGELDEDVFEGLMAARPDEAAALLCDLAAATDHELRGAARRLAGRVFLRLGRTGGHPRRGTRRIGQNRRADGDLDLDRTVARWSGPWPPRQEDLVTRHWAASRRALCLAVDASGSMGGRAVSVAAVAAAAVVLAEDRAEPSVLAFAGDVAVLREQGRLRPPANVVDDLVGLRGHGVTNLADALRSASRQLAAADADERAVVLLSDCLRTAGDDPTRALAGIDHLHVLCPGRAEESRRLAAELSARGNGRWQPVDGLASVVPALTRVLG